MFMNQKWMGRMLAWLAVMMTTAGAYAQGDRDTAAVATVRAMVAQRAEGVRKVMLASAEGNLLNKEALDLPMHNLSAPMKVPSRTLFFHEAADAEGVSSGEKVELGRKVAQVVLPANEREFLLVFIPSPRGSELPYQVLAAPMPGDKFRGGSFAMLNLSPMVLGAQIADQKAVIAPGKCGILSVKSKPGGGPVIYLVYARETNSKVFPQRPILSSRLPIQGKVRNLVLFYQNPKTKRIESRGVPDFVQ